MNKVQLPFGMKDYLPDECYNKQCAESEMGNVFSSYGYKRVAMPALEYCDLFTADGSIPVNKLFKLTDTDGQSGPRSSRRCHHTGVPHVRDQYDGAPAHVLFARFVRVSERYQFLA